ncbi:Glyoxylase, beta-lactamase superfamily II [Bryocella elongata]|uniref:Glyoxylase, beta-lactamase superfamily II n=1 Tax=Bryocella elongata TaxID=863522 RepID=A0A1H5WNM5_9BACT|nr:MBL fold metallo-hydrolase [Bryocella elongata]SEG01072.1 Glyoxylase, beta-lactamase superfamily II [Bryocella elongata]
MMRGGHSVVKLIAMLAVFAGTSHAEFAPPKQVAAGVWFMEGDPHKGYANTVVIEMQRYLIVVDGSYPGRVEELLQEIPRLSPKPIRYAFMTHHHGDHAYGNALWTKAGVTTLATQGVREEMDRYEPERWLTTKPKREDMWTLPYDDVERPRQTFRGRKFVLKDGTREVDFLYMGWGHTRGDGYVWLPREHVLCTGDAVVNGPRNKLWDADLANWPHVIERAEALRPEIVLPGHGQQGGMEMLEGQARFLRDLRNACEEYLRRGLSVEQATKSLKLPAVDATWVRDDMTQDIEIEYSEIKAGKPAGSLPHTWQ